MKSSDNHFSVNKSYLSGLQNGKIAQYSKL